MPFRRDGGLISGRESATGDGTATTFTIPHSLGSDPSACTVTPRSQPASTDHWITTDATAITVHYATAPATGAVLEWTWEARP